MNLFLTAAQPAHAVVQALSGASLSILVDTLPVTTVPWSRTGEADVDVLAKSITGLTAGIFNFTGSLFFADDPGAFPIAELLIPGATNGTGNFFGVDTTAGGGRMAINGFANVCLFAPCASSLSIVTVPFTTNDVNGIGLGGSPITAPGPVVNFTISGNSWTIRSPLTDGTVELVTPTLISTDIGASAVIPSLAVMSLTFIPEPGTMLLLGLGLVGLTVHRRRADVRPNPAKWHGKGRSGRCGRKNTPLGGRG